MLHFFHAAPFRYGTFWCINLFDVVVFPICTFSMLHFLHITQFLFCIFFVYMLHSLFIYCTISCRSFKTLQSFRLAYFSCCFFSMVHFFMLHYFQRCSQDPHKYLRWRGLQQKLTRSLSIVAKLSILDIQGGPGYTSTISMF